MKFKNYTGCSGFAQGYWKGVFYPEELPSREYLNYYAKHLPAVEINSTFYRKPTQKTLQKWYDATGPDFKFFVKISKSITHLKKLVHTLDETELFCEHIAEGLKEKLAGFLFQLPPSFHFSEDNFNKLLTTVHKKHVNVVEFRHKSWWTTEVFQTLNENKIVFCGVSFPNDIPADVILNSSEMLYYRFHGVPVLFKSEYSMEELAATGEKIKSFKGTSFVFFNNTWGTAGIRNALEMQRLLK